MSVTIVEVRTSQFEIWYKGKPTGHYMRGKVIGEINKYTTHILIESLSNGKDYYVNLDNVVIIEESNGGVNDES